MVLYLGVFSLFKGAVGYKMDRKLVTCKFKHFLTLTESNAFTTLTVFRADQLSLPWKQRMNIVYNLNFLCIGLELDTGSVILNFY